MRILIVGNVIKDIYLDLVNHGERFEPDDHGIPWLDIAFDGSTLNYGRRTSVFSGAATSLEVLHGFGHECLIAGHTFNTSFQNRQTNPSRHLKLISDIQIPCAYRYILVQDGHIFYLSPDTRRHTPLSAPPDAVDWIYVDRSALISADFLSSLEKYLKVSPDTKIAVFASTRGYGNSSEIEMRNGAGRFGSRIFSAAMQTLIKKADLIFTDRAGFQLSSDAPIIEISDHEIRFGQIFEHYEVKNSDLLTDLTSFSIISATIFAELATADLTDLTKIDFSHIFKLARINVEYSKITYTLSVDKIKEKLTKEEHMISDLRLVAKTLVSKDKGILAADESGGSIHKKFEAAHIPDDATHRRDYRNIFFTTPDLEKYVNGVILFEETAHQLSDEGTNFVEYLTSKGIISGIKVDQGLEPFSEPGLETEKWTKGLDGLEGRLKQYYTLGARFAKWRAAFEITTAPDFSEFSTPENRSLEGLKTPSFTAIERNAEILARYARACQDNGIVPIVEPEVVHDGDYSLATCAKVTSIILDELFRQLHIYGVDLPSCILKVNMILAGKKYQVQSTPAEVGQKTAAVLKSHVPTELAGVVFLSGGQTVEQSTANLQEITNCGPYPWPVTFSFARALQDPALQAWQGNNDNIPAAREAFAERLAANCAALEKSI